MAIPGDLYLSVDFGASPSTDNGTRPYTGTNPQWNAFSLWLDGGPNQTQTQVDTPTTVKARVSNKGNTPVLAVHVDAYVMNPFVGLAKPNQAIERLSGAVGSIGPGSGSTSPTDAHVVTCSIQDPIQGPIPWKPTQAELTSSATNGVGHLCLIANVFADGDGHQLLEGEDFKVIDDQHQAQRNIALLAKPAGVPMHFMEFQIMPGFEEVQETVIAVEPVDPKVAIGAGECWLLGSQEGFVKDRHIRGGLILERDGQRFPIHLSDVELRHRLLVEGEEFGGRLLVQGEELGGRLLAPFGEPLLARIELEPSEDERPGAVQVVDIVQRDREGRPVGGALRIVTVVTG
jgi:hypothetical protein